MTAAPPPPRALSDADYRRLLAFRDGLRRFLHWSEVQARQVGLTPSQHQLLLAVRGHPGEVSPTVGDIAEHLVRRHHTVVELVDRAEAAGLVRREPDPNDHRLVRLQLTDKGIHALGQLSALHLEELVRLRRAIDSLDIPVEG